jgi:hypothetical protein
VIDQNAPAGLGIEDLVADHHRGLVQYLRDIVVSVLARAGCIELAFFA